MIVAASRDRILARLVEDLIGPLSPDEILSDRPSQRYSTGILYPQGSRIGPEEDDDGGLAANEKEDAASPPDVAGTPLHVARKPSAAGMSFALRVPSEETLPILSVEVAAARYERFAVNAEGDAVPGEPVDRAHERWRRIPLRATAEVEVPCGGAWTDLGPAGVDGLRLYTRSVSHAGLRTVTAALVNCRRRRGSWIYDEEQHFFQVELSVTGARGGTFAPRPSRRAQTDDDSRAAALTYRDVQELVVGHTCAATAVLQKGSVVALKTSWLPAVTVPSVSDRGDPVFETVRVAGERRPLDAQWLAEATPETLAAGLADVVTAYREWIRRERQRIPGLPADLQEQAQKHVDRCVAGADRMNEGIDLIRRQPEVRAAFKLAQQVMQMQFGWLRAGEALTWRPFQLGFQLLVIASLASRRHQDRGMMDLLWFPTGGGKTEAYLALAAFVILLRRLRGTREDDGAGVAVLMRYTLRLLTVQQFQRAAAMICAAELLRRRSRQRDGELPDLGAQPIGLGLWVGVAATPLTLKDALSRSASDASTPEQISACPCCGETLSWKLSPRGSSVKCPTEHGGCELAASEARLPIWTIDEEVYRHQPSLLIGTLDKFAQIVRKTETGVLFGWRTQHAPPDLIIQDELHLVSGPLGSIAGLYEVAIDELCRRGAVRPKVIGSTATIRRAENQIRSLFDRETYQFPAPGLDADNSGFAVHDAEKPGRLHVGLTTAGRSATYMLQALVASLLQAAQEPDLSPGDRDYYWTLVTYFNSLRELGRGLVLMQDDVPVSIGQLAARRAEDPRRVQPPAELTSRVPSYEIRDMLGRLNKTMLEPEAIDVLAASNMISVGLDVPRLGLMIVNAQPKTLSEYIQATSRIGRGEVPGIVVTMYNSGRARDRSHFETFETWHRCLYRDVEPTSVTPFASRAQDKALHAVLVALVRHTVPGMAERPVLDEVRRVEAERIASVIESRVARIDPAEHPMVAKKLQGLIDDWSSKTHLQTYWDDYGRRRSLLMSAEEFAAWVDGDGGEEEARRTIWPTPNSMREVEAGAPFVLRPGLRAGVE